MEYGEWKREIGIYKDKRKKIKDKNLILKMENGGGRE